jgi:hypothetical protein
MPTNLVWENEEHTIVRMELIGRWTWDEAYKGSDEGYRMLESVDHVVNVIIDLRPSIRFPELALTHARNMINKRHPRTGLTVFLGANMLFVLLWRSFSRLHKQLTGKQDFTFATSIEEAHKILEALKT